MTLVKSDSLSVAELGFGSLSVGDPKFPGAVFLDVRDCIDEANVFVGHIEDNIKAGKESTFGLTTELLLASAVSIITSKAAQEAERNIFQMELNGLCRDVEDIKDAQAIVEAIWIASQKIKEKLEEISLFEGDALNYAFSRIHNGQMELVRKTIDDPNSDYRFAQGGFIIPVWKSNEIRSTAADDRLA